MNAEFDAVSGIQQRFDEMDGPQALAAEEADSLVEKRPGADREYLSHYWFPGDIVESESPCRIVLVLDSFFRAEVLRSRRMTQKNDA